jgi:hypothetical protein
MIWPPNDLDHDMALPAVVTPAKSNVRATFLTINDRAELYDQSKNNQGTIGALRSHREYFPSFHVRKVKIAAGNHM